MNISDQTITKLSLDFFFSFYDQFSNEAPAKTAELISIQFSKDSNGQPFEYIGKTIKAPKKMEVTYEWVTEKINQKSVFSNFCSEFNRFLKDKGLRGYPTSYGIGIESLYVSSKNLNENKESIENQLDSLGIKYSTEYSDAAWVFRYKISQSKENIKVLIDSIN